MGQEIVIITNPEDGDPDISFSSDKEKVFEENKCDSLGFDICVIPANMTSKNTIYVGNEFYLLIYK